MSSRRGIGFGNGFVLGVIVGAVVVLLIATKRGRKILRMLSEESSGTVKPWKRALDETDFDSEDENEYVARTPQQKVVKKAVK